MSYCMTTVRMHWSISLYTVVKKETYMYTSMSDLCLFPSLSLLGDRHFKRRNGRCHVTLAVPNRNGCRPSCWPRWMPNKGQLAAQWRFWDLGISILPGIEFFRIALPMMDPCDEWYIYLHEWLNFVINAWILWVTYLGGMISRHVLGFRIEDFQILSSLKLAVKVPEKERIVFQPPFLTGYVSIWEF